MSQAGFLGVVASLNIGFPRHRRITKPQAFTALPDNCPPSLPLLLSEKLKKAEATPSPHPHCRVVGRMWGVLFRSENDKIWLLPEWAAERPLQLILAQDPELRFKYFAIASQHKIRALTSKDHLVHIFGFQFSHSVFTRLQFSNSIHK